MQFVYKCIVWIQFLIILRHIAQDGQILDIAIAYLYTFLYHIQSSFAWNLDNITA